MSETIVKKRRSNFALLNRTVIKPGYCTSCGGCEAVCPVYVISIDQLVPKLIGGCISCGACVDVCLRYKQRVEQPAIEEESLIRNFVNLKQIEEKIKKITEDPNRGYDLHASIAANLDTLVKM